MPSKALAAVSADELAEMSWEQKAQLTAREVLTFEERFQETRKWIGKRRGTIEIVSITWDDIEARLIERVYRQYHLFNPTKGEYRRWVNRVISNELRNIWRDEVGQVSRPCIVGKGGCAHNCGGNLCSKTPSGLQCSECPAYHDWQERKGAQHAIRFPVPLEVHTHHDDEDAEVTRHEASNTQGDMMDREAELKAILDVEMKKRLTRFEYRAYRLLAKGLPQEEVAKQLGFKGKKGKKQRMFPGYLALLSLRHKLMAIAKEIVEDERRAA